MASSSSVAVTISPEAHELERFAAGELCGYLQKLFGIAAEPVAHPAASETSFIVGTVDHCLSMLSSDAPVLPKLSDQGFVLRTIRSGGETKVVIAGCSPRAAMWGVYDLVERCWGVRHLIHRELLPPAGSFIVPDVDVTCEPVLQVRAWSVIGDMAFRTECWGMADYAPVLDQLARLRFNRLQIGNSTWQPFVHHEIDGIKREKAWLWYDEHYPITDDMIGRRLFEDKPEFWNPDLPLNAPYEEFMAAGQRLVHNLISYAHKRGMEAGVIASLMDYPAEFAPLLPSWRKIHQLGEMTIVPGPDAGIDDPAITRLTTAMIQDVVNTYPDADCLLVGLPEFMQWIDHYERAWDTLDRKYGISQVVSLHDVLDFAASRTDISGGAERSIEETKGGIVSLYLVDRLFREMRILDGTSRPDIKLSFDAGSPSLIPIIDRVFPPGSEIHVGLDYTPSRELRRLDVLRRLAGASIHWNKSCTLQDDNIGIMPQLTTTSLEPLHRESVAAGAKGFGTRYMMLGDHDLSVAFISRAAWDGSATRESVYSDLLPKLCGTGADAMGSALDDVEAATIEFEKHGLGFGFPIPNMMMKFWDMESDPHPDLEPGIKLLRQALRSSLASESACDSHDRGFSRYWSSRLRFALAYWEATRHAIAGGQAQRSGDTSTALDHAKSALTLAEQALETYADIVVDRSDLGAIAIMNEHVVRRLREKVRELSQLTQG